MTLWTLVTRVVGANLRDARERRMMLPEQPAELLGTTPQALLAIEEGRCEISTGTLADLTGLYRCRADEPGLRRLLAQRPEWNGMTRDREPGHARRLAACARAAARVAWLSYEHLPAPLQTPHYARAVAEPDASLSGAPRPPAAAAVYVLDPSVLHHGSGTARLMAEQLDHLLRLTEQGIDIRVLPTPLSQPQPAQHIVDITLPAGRILARPTPEGVEYCRTLRFAATIDAALASTDQRSSRDALYRAAISHHARTGTPGTPTLYRPVLSRAARPAAGAPRTPTPAEHAAPASGGPGPARPAPSASGTPRGRLLAAELPAARRLPPGPSWAAFRTAIQPSSRFRGRERRPGNTGAQEGTAARTRGGPPFSFRF
ncbi:Scr1 family TA system antitoxin-like transcriptional regulator [Streptomyces globisporus]|uniref:Scr1 family TA system antitoxin-like transcriptional regulator n=1 Tax=Streptomyces globisporus TaxID=1908 RepID=UPI0036D1B80C